MNQPYERRPDSSSPADDDAVRCSGIEDMRRLAEIRRASDPSPAGDRDPRDSLLGMGLGAFGHPSPLGPPKARRGPWRTLGLVTVATLLAASGTALAMTGIARMDRGQTEVARADTAAEAPAEEPEGSHEVVTEPADEPATPPAAEEPPAIPERPAERQDEALDERAARRPAPVRPSRPAPKPDAPAPKPEPEPDDRGSNELDDLLDRALDGGGDEAADDEQSLPATPSRSEVASTLRGLTSELRRCTDGASGIAQTRILVDGDSGRVRSVNVTGQFAGTEEGSCIARTIREQARFPRFARDRFEIAFPYVL